MSKYRKRPVVIEAFQMTRERRANNTDWPEWLHMAWNLDPDEPGAVGPITRGTSDGRLRIATLEGVHDVAWDDFIIQGVQGELYPCKPDIFAATYEAVDGAVGGLTGPADALYPVDALRAARASGRAEMAVGAAAVLRELATTLEAPAPVAPEEKSHG